MKRINLLACVLAAVWLLTSVVYAEELSPYYQTVLTHNQGLYQTEKEPASYLAFPQGEGYEALSDQITAGRSDEKDKVQAIHDWVCSHIYYDDSDFGMGIEISSSEEWKDSLDQTSAAWLETYHRGNCAYYARVFRNLVRAQGIACLEVDGYTVNDIPQDSTGVFIVDQTAQTINVAGDVWTQDSYQSMSINHRWNEVYLDGRWVIVDPTWDSGNRYENGQYKDGSVAQSYFDISLAELSKNHKILSYEGTHTSDSAGISLDDAMPIEQIDPPDDWAASMVEEAITRRMVPEELQNWYHRAITREEFAALAAQYLAVYYPARLAQSSTAPVFSDTQNMAVAQMASLGIVSGVGGGRFAPQANITRQEAAVMLQRLCHVIGLTAGTVEGNIMYEDAAQIAPWAKEAVEEVRILGLMNGTGKRYEPLGLFTRQQAISVFYLLSEK